VERWTGACSHVAWRPVRPAHLRALTEHHNQRARSRARRAAFGPRRPAARGGASGGRLAAARASRRARRRTRHCGDNEGDRATHHRRGGEASDGRNDVRRPGQAMDVGRSRPPLPRPRTRQRHGSEGCAARRIVPSRAHWPGSARSVYARSRAACDASATVTPCARNAQTNRANCPPRARPCRVSRASDQGQSVTARLLAARRLAEGEDVRLPKRGSGSSRVRQGAARLPRALWVPDPRGHARRGGGRARMVRRGPRARHHHARKEQDERPARVGTSPRRGARLEGLARVARGARHPRRVRVRRCQGSAVTRRSASASKAPHDRGSRARCTHRGERRSATRSRSRPPRNVRDGGARERSHRSVDRRSNGPQVEPHDQSVPATSTPSRRACLGRSRSAGRRDSRACPGGRRRPGGHA
jgi:hypothetical protein